MYFFLIHLYKFNRKRGKKKLSLLLTIFSLSLSKLKHKQTNDRKYTNKKKIEKEDLKEETLTLKREKTNDDQSVVKSIGVFHRRVV